MMIVIKRREHVERMSDVAGKTSRKLRGSGSVQAELSTGERDVSVFNL
jgi:hypothetical protein